MLNQTEPARVSIEKGSILIYRVFDIAEEINLQRVEEIFRAQAASSRLRFLLSPRQVVIMRNAPVTLSLGEAEITVLDRPVKAEVYAKFWDYGVLSLQFQIPIERGSPWSQMVEWGARIELDTLVDEAARFRAQELLNLVHPALRDPHHWNEIEDYVIYFFEEIAGIQKARDLVTRADVAKLILAEPNAEISEPSRQEILQEGLYQYAENDLTIIDWNSAIVVEPSGKKEVPEVIEFVLTHMMEMRYYDGLLDERLATIYDAIEESRSRFFSNRFSILSREASARYIEFSEFIERVDNSFKVVGDFYLAKIFRGAGEQFRIPEWEANISRKINIFSNLSELLQGEVNATRSLWLEITIVVLISFELFTTFAKFPWK
jgi:hypothetical protein